MCLSRPSLGLMSVSRRIEFGLKEVFSPSEVYHQTYSYPGPTPRFCINWIGDGYRIWSNTREILGLFSLRTWMRDWKNMVGERDTENSCTIKGMKQKINKQVERGGNNFSGTISFFFPFLYRNALHIACFTLHLFALRLWGYSRRR